jgi:hypothetical protein
MEISLVDRPCNPEASINMWKADGGFESDDLELEAPDGAWAAEIAQASKALFTNLATARDDRPVQKIGRRNSARDQAAIQASHDQMVGLGAVCDPDNCDFGDEDDDASADAAADDIEPEDDQKSAAIADLTKAWTQLSAEKDALKAQVDNVAPQLQALRAEIDLLKAQPMPPKTAGSLHATVEKAADARGFQAEALGELSLDAVQRVLDAMPAQARADLLMKAAMARPIPIRA